MLYGRGMIRITALAAPLAALGLAACAADTASYPSLARRDAERITGSAETVPPSPSAGIPATAPPPADSGLAARLSALTAAAQDAHARFGTRRAAAERLSGAARGGAAGGPAWSAAMVALADLESARSDGMIALADADQLYAAAKVSGDDPAAITAIVAARDRMIALIAQEDKALATLRGRISPSG